MTVTETVHSQPPFPAGAGARVTLIMPVRNEGRNLLATLESLNTQTFDQRRLNLLIVDGASDDATVGIAEGWLSQHAITGRILTNVARTIPAGLNVGIRAARLTDIIVRLDGHTLYGPTYLEELIGLLETAPADVACVGGPQRPISDDAFEHRLVSTLYSNPMGLGGAEHRSGKAIKYVKQVYLGAWRPGVLQQVGGFDERWQANEDSELSARIVAAAWRILWAPLDCTYAINRGLVRSVRQWGGYGFWRAQTLRRYPDLAKPRHFAAPLALVLALVLACTPLRPLLLVGALLYAVMVVAKRAPGDSVGLALAGTFFFPLCQAAWSVGLLRGLLYKPPAFAPFVDDPGAVEGQVPVRRMGNITGSWQEDKQAVEVERGQ